MADWFAEYEKKQTNGASTPQADWFGKYDQAQSQTPIPPAAPSAPTSAMGNVLRFGRGLVVNPLTGIVETVRRIGAGPESTGQLVGDILQSHIQTWQKARQAAREGRYSEAFGYGLGTALPVIGPAATAAAEKIGEGQVAEGLGEAASLVATLPTPMRTVVKPIARAAGKGFGRSSLRGGYEISTPAAEVESAVQTMAEHQIPFSSKGISQLGQAIDDLQKTITAEVRTAAGKGATINPAKVRLRIEDLRAKYGRQVNPAQDLADIRRVDEAFARRWQQPIPADVAQELKVGSGQQIGGKYGQMRTAQIEAEKALTRGLKEELETQIPELKALNAKQAKLLDLEGILRKAVNKYVNSGGFLGDITGQVLSREGAIGAGGLGVAAAFGHGGAAAAALVMRSLLRNPRLQQVLALQINKAQQLNPAKWGAPSMATATGRVTQYLKSIEQRPEQSQ